MLGFCGERMSQMWMYCPGQRPPFFAVKRPAYPYKSPKQTRFNRETLRPLNRPGRARTVSAEHVAISGAPSNGHQHSELTERLWPESAMTGLDCPGRKPPFRAAKRPARPYKSPIQNGTPMENAKVA